MGRRGSRRARSRSHGGGHLGAFWGGDRALPQKHCCMQTAGPRSRRVEATTGRPCLGRLSAVPRPKLVVPMSWACRDKAARGGIGATLWPIQERLCGRYPVLSAGSAQVESWCRRVCVEGGWVRLDVAAGTKRARGTGTGTCASNSREGVSGSWAISGVAAEKK